MICKSFSDYNWTDGFHVSIEDDQIERIYRIENNHFTHQLLVNRKELIKGPAHGSMDTHGKHSGRTAEYEFRPATEEEINWVQVCINRGEYVRKKEALKPEFEDGYYHVEWNNGAEAIIEHKDGQWGTDELSLYCKNWHTGLGNDDWNPDWTAKPASQDQINQYNLSKELGEYFDEGYYKVDFTDRYDCEHYVKLNKSGDMIGKYLTEHRGSHPVLKSEVGHCILNWCESRKLTKMQEDRQKWFDKCLEQDKVLEFPLKEEYKYADVVYDFEKMDSEYSDYWTFDFSKCLNDINELYSAFDWEQSPQGHNFWEEIAEAYHTKESIHYLNQMKSQYEDYLVAKSKPDPAQEELVIVPGEVYHLGSHNWIVRADANGEFRNSSYIMPESDWYDPDTHVCGVEEITRKAYPTEVDHLELCERLGEFVPKDYVEPAEVTKETREFNGQQLDIDELLKVLQHSESSKKVHQNSAEYWKYEYDQLKEGFNNLDNAFAEKIEELHSVTMSAADDHDIKKHYSEACDQWRKEYEKLQESYDLLSEKLGKEKQRSAYFQATSQVDLAARLEYADKLTDAEKELAKYQKSKFNILKEWLVG